MTKSIRKTIILAKKEATYNSDVTPAAVNALHVSNVNIEPVAADTLPRDFIDGKLGSKPEMRVRKTVSLSFDVELAGSGAAGTAPAWGVLLQGCGLSETLTANTKAVYKPVSSSFGSLFYLLLRRRHQAHPHGRTGQCCVPA